jgi:SAM-dependent MidA family methyltransferase
VNAAKDLGKTRLVDILRGRIKREGPITFEQFMEAALYEPGLGYYATAIDGPDGATRTLTDYQTSPQVHPLFGHLMARELRQIWETLGSPEPFVVVELGAGGGELSHQILAGLADGVRTIAMRYHAVDWRYARTGAEIETVESSACQQIGCGRGKHVGAPPDHIRAVSSITRWPDLPTLATSVRDVHAVVSNEFFDALPVHRLTRVGGALREIYVDWAESGFIERVGDLSDPGLAALIEHRNGVYIDGWCGEACSRLERILALIAGVVDRGVVLTIDYGFESGEALGSSGETLVAYHRHQWNDDVYRRVGEQDLTSHLDVAALLDIGRKVGLMPVGVTTQREFLLGLGFADEAERLAALERTPGRQWQARFAVAELIDPRGLGRLKVITQLKA